MENKMKVIIGADVSTKTNKEYVDAAFCETLLRDMKPVLEAADFRIYNLENVLCEEGVGAPIIKSGPNLMGYPKNIEFFTTAKADCAQLANNHFGDFGDEAIVSTLDILKENNIAYIGGGMNKAEAYKAWYAEKNGVKVAFISVCENEFGCATDTKPGAAGFEMKLLRDRIVEEKANADFVVVIFHGGNETNPIPAPATVDRYRLIIDLGADALVGAHTHCMQGCETYAGKPIIYSMGNFFFRSLGGNADNSSPWNYGYLTELNIEKGKNITFNVIPYALLDDATWLHVLDGEDKEIIMAYLEKLSDIIKDPVAVQNYFDAWCIQSGIGYVSTLSIYSKELEADTLTEDQRRVAARVKNIFSCESHNFLITNLLRMEYEGRMEAARALLPELLELRKMPKISLA